MLSFTILLAASVAEQMAPARKGLLQCQSPNIEERTCFSLSSVLQTSPGTYRFQTAILLDAAGPVIASIRSSVFVRGEQVCQRMNPNDWAGATVTFDGRPLSGAELREYRTRLRSTYAGVAGRTICTRIVAGGEGLATVVSTLDGKRIPAGDYPMKWVAPADGWKVAP